MRNRKSIITLVALIAFVASCGIFQPTNLKPEQEFLMRAESFYLSQYNDYKSMAAMPNLTDDQKTLLREKKKVLVEVEPMIKLYGAIVYGGGTPSPDLEFQIIGLLNKIGGRF